ncbi:gemin2 [Symbiodinium natans]|uniref:Gemin2 protein n=1 Tax=Symbiodinium natans TaxID=878477 RepID=A0A812G9P7_9DINO|nr:gemin2 [Symbiodinium natans]
MALGEEYEEVDDEAELRADRDQQILQEACLPVSGAPMPPSEGPPKDADEYLRQVQWERLHCPEIVDVDVKERQSKRRVGGPLTGKDGAGGLLSLFQAPEVPARFRHAEAWASDAAASFRHLRGQCERQKAGNGAQSLSYEEWRRHVAKDRPDSQLIAAQDFVGINHLVVVAIDKFEADFEAFQQAAPDAEGGFLSGFQSEGIDSVSEWIFAALAFVEEPLVDDIQYQLQRLRRLCCRFAEGTASKVGSDLDTGAAGATCAFLHPRVALLLVLVSEVFGQH